MVVVVLVGHTAKAKRRGGFRRLCEVPHTPNSEQERERREDGREG